MDPGFDRVRGLLEARGFATSFKRVRYRTVTGGVVVEDRLVAVGEGVRLSVSRVGGGWRLSLIAEGEWGDEDVEDLEMLGGLVEVEDDRITAVFRGVPGDKLERLVLEVLDSIGR